MTLHAILTAAMGRSVLAEKQWSDAVTVSVLTAGCGICVQGELTAGALYDFIPFLAAQHYLHPDAVVPLQALCQASPVSIRITDGLNGDVVMQGFPDEKVFFAQSLKAALLAALADLVPELEEKAEILALHTGERWNGFPLFERVTAESWDALPGDFSTPEAQINAWLHAIFEDGSDVLQVGLVVWQDSGQQRLADCAVPDICIIPPGVPARCWLDRDTLKTLATEVRRQIYRQRSLTASFSRVRD
ncbi:MAG TPA: hypothetical protein VGL07_19210 [Buttiauxella sp.]|jgi:hypothetical protein